MKTKFKSISTVLNDFIEDLGINEEIDESVLKKWATDIIKLASTDEQYKFKMTHLFVEDFKAELPEDVDLICNVVYRIPPPKEKCGKRTERISQFVQNVFTGDGEKCELEINVSCPKCTSTVCKCDTPSFDVDITRLNELTLPQLHHSGFMRISSFGHGAFSKGSDPLFKPLRCVRSPYFQSEKFIPECVSFFCESKHSYTLQDNTLECNFRKGEVIVAYLAREIDENRDYKVPDHPAVYFAITDYLAFKYFYRKYMQTGQADFRIRFKEAEVRWREGLGAARSALQTPDADCLDAYLKTWRSRIPKNNYSPEEHRLKYKYGIVQGYRGSRRRNY